MIVNCIVLYIIVLYCIVLHCIVLYCIVSYGLVKIENRSRKGSRGLDGIGGGRIRTFLFLPIFFYESAYDSLLCCIVYYCIVLHCIVLYCIVSYGLVKIENRSRKGSRRLDGIGGGRIRTFLYFFRFSFTSPRLKSNEN